MNLIIVILGFMGFLLLGAIIYNIYYSIIPSNYIKVESFVDYYEEHIPWNDGFSSEDGPEIKAPYFEPIIKYTLNGKIIQYRPKKNLRFDKADFNKTIEIYLDPNAPEKTRHKIR